MNPFDTEFTTQLRLVEDRLSETWEALIVQCVINERANKEDNPQLNAIINKHPGFWRVANFSLQSGIFVGLFALLDKDQSSASMYSILRHAKHQFPDPSLNSFETTLDALRDKYAKYRHKIFGHNDKQRNDVIAQFNTEGFTWESLERDIEGIDHIWKTIWLLHRGDAAPSEETSKAFQFPHNNSCRIVGEHTDAFLQAMLPGEDRS
jgi:hypothetical protein